jgi:hypothetical protein
MSFGWHSWLIWGFVATAVLTMIMSSSTGVGLTRINVPFMLGTMFTPSRDRAKLAGFFVHLVNGWMFSLLYVAALHAMHQASWWRGAIIGALHGAFVLTVAVPILPGLHPRMATEQHGPEVEPLLEPPGFLALNYGIGTPVTVMVAHVVFGMILGALYRVT